MSNANSDLNKSITSVNGRPFFELYRTTQHHTVAQQVTVIKILGNNWSICSF